jgi:PAS domain-containing protein
MVGARSEGELNLAPDWWHLQGRPGGALVPPAAGISVDRRPQPTRSLDELWEISARESHDAIFGLDESGQIDVWTRGAARLFGYDAADILGQDGEALLTAELADGHRIHSSASTWRRYGPRRGAATASSCRSNSRWSH